MASRPQGTKYAVTGVSKLITTGIGNLYSFNMSWRGCTAGDRVIVYDGLDATGTVMCEIILNDANSSGPAVQNIMLPSVGKEFKTGLFVNLGGITGGEVNVSVGYDNNA